MLDDTSKQRPQDTYRNLTNATQLCFAERALLREHSQFLSKIDNGRKKRWSEGKSTVSRHLSQGQVPK